jgi:thiamine-phosphate pyrophosphorylase
MTEPCRLYLITPPEIADLRAFEAALAAALDAGDVAALQIRIKSRDGVPAPDDLILRCADRALPLARARRAVVLVNDRPDLASRCGADGVHLGRSDGAIRDARALLGPDATIGATCHNSRHFAIEAAEAGADYVAFGAFFPTATKTAAARADLETLRAWSMATTVPCVAVGGVTPENCAEIVRAGADFLAVSSAVWDCPDGPAAAVNAFARAIAGTGRSDLAPA